MIDSDTRDRVIRMEAEVENLEQKVDHMSKKIDDMHDVLMQARGARYVIVGAAAIGGAVTGFLVKLLPFTHSLPK
jgi:hypothetical protein